MAKESGKRRTLLDAPERRVVSTASASDGESGGNRVLAGVLEAVGRRERERPRQSHGSRGIATSSERLLGSGSGRRVGLSKATRSASRSSAKQLMEGCTASEEEETSSEGRREGGRWLKSLTSKSLTSSAATAGTRPSKQGTARTPSWEHPHVDDYPEVSAGVSSHRSSSFAHESDYAALEDGIVHTDEQKDVRLCDSVLRQEETIEFRGSETDSQGVLFPPPATEAMSTVAEDLIRKECSLLYGGSSYRPRRTLGSAMLPTFSASSSDAQGAPSATSADSSGQQRRLLWNFRRRRGDDAEDDGGRYFNDGYELRPVPDFASSSERVSRRGKRRRGGTFHEGAEGEENSPFYLNPRTRADFRERYERLNHEAEVSPALPNPESPCLVLPSALSSETRLSDGSWVIALWKGLLGVVGVTSTGDAHPKPPTIATSSRDVPAAGRNGALGSLESPTVHADGRHSSLLKRTGTVQIRLPKDNVRLLMDPFLEPGILSVEKTPCVPIVGDTNRHEEDDFSGGKTGSAAHVRSSLENEENPSPNEISTETTGWTSDVLERVQRGSDDRALPNLQYVLTVDADLYRRVVDEMADSWALPFGLYYCCHNEDEETPRVNIQVAVAILGVLFSLFVIATLIWPLD